MIKRFALSILLAGCTLDVSVGTGGPSDGRTEVALVPTTISDDLDLLFVLDDSPGAVDLQLALQNAFPTFLQALGPQGLPSLHIGVVSTDLGTSSSNDAIPGPSIGSVGAGGCGGRGKNGDLISSAAITGNFISDIEAGGGTRETNYTGTLAEAFKSISTLGNGGCGFEQPLQAAKRALNNNPVNVGFLRENAPLAIVVVTNEDDCSLSTSALMGPESSTLGPLQSFRCTRFGVVCDNGGATPDDMNKLGDKSLCHSSPTSQYLTSINDTANFLKSLERDARNITFGAIAGVATSLRVGLETPPGGGTAIPALEAACVWPSTGGTEIDPAIRINEFAGMFARHRVEAACGAEMTTAAQNLGLAMRGMLGRDRCLTLPIGLPADCEVWDTRLAGPPERLPACGNTLEDCWRLVDDPSCVQGLRIDVVRDAPPTPDTMVSVRCTL